MSPQTVQISELLRQIDEALRKSAPRFPWLQSAEASLQRQVLQQTRGYLLMLQQQARELEDRPLTHTQEEQSPAQSAGRSAETAQQVLQAVLQEMNYLRSNMLQPLRADVDALQQRRDALTQEVRQLEAQRQQALPAGGANYLTGSSGVNPHVSELLQHSMQQLQENLAGQVAHMMEGMVLPDQPLLGSGDSLTPAQRLQQMQRLQSQSDHLMMRLDSAIRIIFESMQANLKSYEDSLEQGLNRMHTLGQQGEAMFSALVSRLAEHLGRETSTYLQSSLQSDAPHSGFLQEGVPPTPNEIDQLLGELNALSDESSELDESPDRLSDLSSNPPDHPSQNLPSNDLFAAASRPWVDFSQDDFSRDDEDITLFQSDLDFIDEDITVFQEEEELFGPFDLAAAHPEAANSKGLIEDENLDEDLTSAIDLLGGNQSDESEPEPEAIVDNDEFYQSLFGQPVEESGSEHVVENSLEDAPDSVPENPPENLLEDAPENLTENSPENMPENNLGNPSEESPVLSNISDISDLFFSGMGDPADDEPEPSLSEPAPELASDGLAQSVEAFLLKSPEPEPEEPAVDTIATLSDLLGSEPPAEVDTVAEVREENSYEAARPEENLLAGGETAPALIDPEMLSQDTRQLLESDLLSLEKLDFPEPLVKPADVQADMTLFDDDGFDSTISSTFQVNNTMPQESLSTANTSPLAEGNNAFSFEGLDDELFEPSPQEELPQLDPEALLKKKRNRVKGESGRGFGR